MTSRHRIAAARLVSLAAIGAALSFAPARAQTTPPAVAVPQMQCEKPGDSPGVDPSPTQMNRFQKRVDDYKVCVNDYAKTTGAKANEYAELARAHANAANTAIEGYNAYVTELNEKVKRK